MDAPGPATDHNSRPSALSAMLARLYERRWRTVGFITALNLGIALLLAATAGGFWTQLTYSVAIGTSCTLIIEGTRLAAAYLSDRVRMWRGLRAEPMHGAEPGPQWFSGWRVLVPALVLALLLGPAIGFWLGDLLTGLRSPRLLQFDNPGTRTTLTITALASTLAVVMGVTIERLATARALAQAAQRQAAENQLRLLQSQLEPHMLFNTLANLRVLIGLDAERAQAMLDHLIAFLRTTLAASRADTQPLSVEFNHLSDYLALMAVRMGPRLQVRLSLPTELADVPVPPLMLQPLVENSIQHGLEPKVDGGRIDVSARRDGAELVLVVRD
ncbi:MAG: histidine kinase, partial [Rubrivivax sp.]